MVRSRLMCSVIAVLAASAAAAWLLPVASSAAAERAAAEPRHTVPGAGRPAQMASVVPDQPLLTRSTFSNALTVRVPGEANAAAPALTRVVIESGRPTMIDGTARPHRIVSVAVSGRTIGETKAAADGHWQVAAPSLGSGDHSFVAVSASRDGGRKELSETVRVSIPSSYVGAMTWSAQTASTVTAGTDDAVLRQAQTLADAVTAHVDELMPELAGRNARLTQPALRLAQAQPTGTAPGNQTATDDSLLGVFTNWLQRSATS
jgi:hypothetical protein